MKVLLPFVIVMLLILAGCRPDAGLPNASENTAPSTAATQPTTESSQPDSTRPTVTDTRFQIFRFQKGYLQMDAWTKLYDLNDCIDGHFYSGDPVTGEVVWLHDETLDNFKQRKEDDWQGKYICYQKQGEPNKLYAMDYIGSVHDRLLYESPTNNMNSYTLLAHLPNKELVAILDGNQQLIVVDIDAAAVVAEYTNEDGIFCVVDFTYDGNILVVFQKGPHYYNYAFNIETKQVNILPAQ